MAAAPTRRADLIAAVRARGGQPRDLRDAAHEACHALDVSLSPPWTRDRIHDAVIAHCGNEPDTEQVRLIGLELRARAVEHVVCRSRGIEHDLSAWAITMWMETASSMRIFIPQPERLPDTILGLANRPTIRAMVAQINKLR